jgi:dimethylhistidine N-methyltransferase
MAVYGNQARQGFITSNSAGAETDSEEYCAPKESFREQIVGGLTRRPKMLAAKFFYDKLGSQLFERICRLPEYYPTRTETGILARYAGEIAAMCGLDCLLIELGSGSSTKTRMLLDRLTDPAAYAPVDIARDQLAAATQSLQADYPDLAIVPVCADYTNGFHLPSAGREPRKTVVFFPGSTIGNFEPYEALVFLRRFAETMRPGDAMIIGVDLRKPRDLLEQAYNDSEGVTAQFNLNLLRRINRELGADFDLDRFVHRAIYNDLAGRIEMHLVSTAEQTVQIDCHRFPFRKAEWITTEHSYKYTVEGFRILARAAGFKLRRVWTDPNRWFSVHYLEL